MSISDQTQVSEAGRRRLARQAAMWNSRLAQCSDYRESVAVLFDRCKAAAAAADRRGNTDAFKDLALLLHRWAEPMELWAAQHDPPPRRR